MKSVSALGYVIENGNESPVILSVVLRMTEMIGRLIELNGAGQHTSYNLAMLLNDAGADIETIQSVIGDADFKTVAERYAHRREDKIG